MNLKIEEAFEDAVATFLADISGFTIFKGFDEQNFITPRIEIEVSSLEFLETLDQLGEALPEYGKFDIQLNVRCVTNMDDGTTRSTHYNGVSDLRTKFLRSANNFTSTNLPDHNVSYLRMASSANLVEGGVRVTDSLYAIRAAMVVE